MSHTPLAPPSDASSAPAVAESPAVDRTALGLALNAAVGERLDEVTLAHAHRRIQRKAVVIGAWYLISYVVVLFAGSWWLGILACTSFAVAMAGVGFNIQHDANHNALFRTRGTKRLTPANRAVGWSMYALGGSATQWIKGHVNVHHSATNVVGKDDDIALAPFARLAPQQDHRPWHRFQHLYLWALYCFTAVSIMVADVFTAIAEGAGAPGRGRRHSAREYTVLLGTKVVFLGATVVVPLLLHPWWIVVLGIAYTLAVAGLLLGVVFQLAHAVEEAEFRGLDDPQTCGWHEWQVRSTVDFCHGVGPVSRAVTWYCGGLNYQTEHHLFPRVPHTAYPEIAPVVREVCAAHGVQHRVQPTMRMAVASHYRHLRRLGRPTGTVIEVEARP